MHVDEPQYKPCGRRGSLSVLTYLFFSSKRLLFDIYFLALTAAKGGIVFILFFRFFLLNTKDGGLRKTPAGPLHGMHVLRLEHVTL